MSDFRDFVGVNSTSDADAYANNQAYVSTKSYSQVYAATHKGEQRLPFMNRSFISFSFGGKYIEDFNLIATIENNRWNRKASAEFEDLVDEYNILDGQFYWGTHYKPNKISFRLATDGITQRELEDFRNWFAGGKTRELILSEHPNRAILARVSTPPNFTLLPFEEPATITIKDITYSTSTTKYKGEITLDLVMDLPFWYSKINIFGYYDEGTHTYRDTWTDANGKTISVLNAYENLDVMKIVLEDNIPISSMITTSLLLGNNTFANLEGEGGGHIAENTLFVYFQKNADQEVGGVIVLIGIVDISTNLVYLVTEEPVYLYNEVGEIDISQKTMIVDALNQIQNDVTLTSESTIEQLVTVAMGIAADPPPEPSVEEEPEEESNESGEESGEGGEGEDEEGEEQTEEQETTPVYYIDITAHAIAIKEDDDPEACIYGTNPETHRVGTACIAGPHMAEDTGIEQLDPYIKALFYYAGTAPANPTIEFNLTPMVSNEKYIYTPANSYESHLLDGTKVLQYNTITIESLAKHEFKFTTPNIYTSYNEAVKIFTTISTQSGQTWEKIRALIRDNVKHYAVRAWANRIIDSFVKLNDSGLIAGNEDCLTLMHQFLLDANGNISPAHFYFDGSIGQALGRFTIREFQGESTVAIPMPYVLKELEEDVSDMIKSNYLIITDRNHPDTNGCIVARTEDSDYTKTYTHTLEHDVQGGLQNVFIRYKNMYL